MTYKQFKRLVIRLNEAQADCNACRIHLQKVMRCSICKRYPSCRRSKRLAKIEWQIIEEIGDDR